jgi:hypothetical protein
MTPPAAGVAADVVINPKKSLLTTDFAAIVNEVSRAFVVIEEKLSQKLSANVAEASNGIAESRRPRTEDR